MLRASSAIIKSFQWVLLQVFEQLYLDCLLEDNSDSKMEARLEEGENRVREEDILSQALTFLFKILLLSSPYVWGIAYKDLEQNHGLRAYSFQ